MGVSIDLNVYSKQKLMDKLEEWADISYHSEVIKLNAILDSCGITLGDNYLIMDNEYFDDYNPLYCLFELLESAFGKTASYDCFDVSMRGINTVDKEEIAEELGFELKEE